MTRTKRLQPVVEHTDKKEQRALREVAVCQAELDTALALLQRLHDYKHEYLQRKKPEPELFSPLQLQEFNRFLQQLETTITGQQEVVERCAAELERKRQAWHASRMESKMMHKVVDKLERQESVELDRKEQKVQDEFALRNNPGRQDPSA